jgi:Transposase DDE domain group 1
VSAAFDGGRITSDGGVMLLAQAERRICIVDRLARLLPDERDASRVTHLLPDILRAASSPSPAAMKMLMTSTGCGSIRRSSWRAADYPILAGDLCSQPTVSRWENAPSLRDLIRLMGVMVDLYCASYTKPPNA